MSETNSRTLDPVIEGYLSYLLKVGRKKHGTVVDVRCTLRRAVSHLPSEVPLWQLRLEDFLHWLEEERRGSRSETCLAKYLCHLRGFLDYAWRSGRSNRNVLDGFSLKHSLPRIAPRSLTLEEAERLVVSTASRGPTARRDRLVVLLLYGCGLRTAELCSLNVAHINRERHELEVMGKGDKERCIPIPEALYTELLAYLLESGKRGPLFRTTTRRCRLTTSDVCGIVKEAVARAGLRGEITPRTLRHSFATHLMDRGVDLAVISSLMGHRSPQETGVYLHVLPSRTEAAVRTLSIGDQQ